MSDHELLNAMVNRDADPVNVEPSFAGQICSISTHLPNRILLLNCPGQLYSFLHSAIRTSYRPGIQREQGQQVLILNGLPFQAPGPGETFGPQIHCAIVRCMLACGWEIACSTTISLRVPDVHTFFFKKGRAHPPGRPLPLLCAMTFISNNAIRLVDAPVALVELVKITLEGHWNKGVQGSVIYKITDGVPQFTMKGRLFDASGEAELIASRTILGQLISKLINAGFFVVTACQSKVTNAGMRPQELDTWLIKCPEELNEDNGNDDMPRETFRD